MRSKQGRSTSSKSIVIFSDIHVGSKYAVCSKKPSRAEDDGPYTPNRLQRKLFEAWQWCRDELTQKPKALIINGEPIDGPNRKALGEAAWSTDVNDHLTDAEKLLKMIPHEVLIFVRGSDYHVKRDATSYEETLAKLMGAKRYRAFGGSGFTDYECNVEIFGKHIHFTHHVGRGTWLMYRPTHISKELVKRHFKHAATGFHTDVIVRSHVHYYVEVRFPHTIGFSTPAWKFADPFAYKQGDPDIPNVGCMEIIIESNGKIIVEPHIANIIFKPNVLHL